MLPLTGVKVVEIAQNIAGPYAGEILANLGADVVKVERPNSGDDARYWGTPITPDASHIFHSLNLNKRSIAIDLTDPVAVAWLKVYIGNATCWCRTCGRVSWRISGSMPRRCGPPTHASSIAR